MSAVQSEITEGAGAPGPAEVELPGPLGALLPLLLRAMDWQRSDRVLCSAVCESGPLSLAGFAQALRRLSFEVTVGDGVPARWGSGADAALVRVARDGEVEALVRRSGVTSLVAPDIEEPSSSAPTFRAHRYALIVDTSATPLPQQDPTVAWSPSLRRVTRRAFLLSFFINLLALSVPIFSMQVYDRVIGGNAPEVLPWFGLGAGLAILFMLLLRRQRSRLLAGAHARLGYQLSLAVLDRMLRLPLLVAGKLRRAGLVSRVRELERVRDRLAAANTVAVFDAPFILLSLVAVAAVGGWLVLVPALYLALFAFAATRVTEYVAAGSRMTGQALAEREAMLADLAENAAALKGTQAAPGWSRRFVEVSADAVRGGYLQGVRLGLAQSTAYVLGTGTALATLVVGLEVVLAGSMTTGGLIASMLLIWRITAPAQALFLAVSRLRQVGAAKAQLQRFFAAPYDATDAGNLEPARLEMPGLTFERVSFRYASDREPALAGVSFNLDPGEILAVVGPNGAGKTTLLRLAAGLFAPQGGLIMIGGRNIRQFDPEDLQLVVGYYPEHSTTFTATLADNLRAAAPGASDDNLRAVIRRAWPSAPGEQLSGALDTRVPIPESQGLSDEDDQRLGFARLLLKPKPLMLVADPGENADPDAPAQVRAFVEQGKAFIQAMRGRSTILLATHNPELIALADKALVLDKGQPIHFGPIGEPEPSDAHVSPGSAS